MINRHLLRTLLGASVAVTLSTAATLAKDVTLENFDRTIQVSGELIGFDGVTYTVASAIGVMSIAASNVSCRGTACPMLDDAASDVELVSFDDDTKIVLH